MPFAENFHPEWGVLAPTPNFVRTIRTVLVATAIGATAGAGTVLALMDRPVAEARNPVQDAPAMVMLAPSPASATTTGTVTPSTAETSAASAALTELNSAPPAPDKIDKASRDGTAATPPPSEAASVRPEPPLPAIAAAENETGKGAAKKHRKTVHRRHRIQDAYFGRDRGGERGYNTAYRQW
jgi:hypothetical protein